MDETASFFNTFPQRNLAAGEQLLSPGEQPDGIYYIVSGQIRQYDIAPNGDEIVVNVFGPGAHFPMSSVLLDEENAWFYQAIDEVTIHVAPSDATLEFLKSSQSALLAYVERLCSGAMGQQRRMAHLMGGSARTRVMYELIVEAKRFGMTDSNGVALDITDQELASKSGLSREAVGRELSKLKSEDLITRSYKKIAIPSLDRLQQELDTGL